jgi:hypothetical protein
MLLSEATSLLAAPLVLLAVLLVVVLWGPDRIYQRMLELIRVLRGGGSSQSEPGATPGCRRAAEFMIIFRCRGSLAGCEWNPAVGGGAAVSPDPTNENGRTKGCPSYIIGMWEHPP